MSEARQVIDKHITEADFMQQIIDLALRTGWRSVNGYPLIFHPYDMRRSREGYPDLTMLHPERGLLLFVECKRQGRKRQINEAQDEWLYALGYWAVGVNGDCGQVRALAFVWQPSDWKEVVRVVANQEVNDV